MEYQTTPYSTSWLGISSTYTWIRMLAAGSSKEFRRGSTQGSAWSAKAGRRA
ncbi:MAG: hypothetical protein QXP99_03160 [Thermoproteota archaeon]